MRCMLAAQGRPIQFVDATPKHGIDFCDSCGDCLHCEMDSLCHNGGVHVWVVENHARADEILASLMTGGKS